MPLWPDGKRRYSGSWIKFVSIDTVQSEAKKKLSGGQTISSGEPDTGRIGREEAERLVLKRGWLADRSAEIRQAVLKTAQLVFYPSGDFVFHVGDEAGGIYGVVDGGVGVHVPTDGGETALVHILRRGTWFGYGPYLRPQRRTLSFSLIEPTCLMFVPLGSLNEISQRTLEHQKAILTISEYGMDVAISALGTALTRNTARRIAATLLRVMEPLDTDHGPSVIRLSQVQIGEMANADRQVVNRVLRRLETQGWVKTSYGQIEITDPQGLSGFVNQG